MDPQIRQLVDISRTPVAMRARAEMILDRARWASQIFQRYDRKTTQGIADAAARAAHAKAGDYAEWAVRETGFGVVEHKRLKNELSSLPLVDYYRDWNFVDPSHDEDTGSISDSTTGRRRLRPGAFHQSRLPPCTSRCSVR